LRLNGWPILEIYSGYGTKLAMIKIKLTLPIINEGSSTLTLYLEPFGESYSIHAGQRVVVCAEIVDSLKDAALAVGCDASTVTVYAPGGPEDFIDLFVIRDGERVVSDDAQTKVPD
jgi:hypothetical protein